MSVKRTLTCNSFRQQHSSFFSYSDSNKNYIFLSAWLINSSTVLQDYIAAFSFSYSKILGLVTIIPLKDHQRIRKCLYNKDHHISCQNVWLALLLQPYSFNCSEDTRPTFQKVAWNPTIEKNTVHEMYTVFGVMLYWSKRRKTGR